ncbi:MAG: ShlB/FhaC/HecB family hemolysin secretion/activation protein [Cyclobacteriaceae bacterium]
MGIKCSCVLGIFNVLTGKQTLLYQYLRGGIMNSDRLFQNDLYRLGGFRSVRGFNENQFFASQYLIYTLEWQLYFDESSNIMAFIDQSFFRSNGITDNPTGVGVGLTLQTGGGLLQIAYAVGRTSDQGFDMRLSKFHFGYKAKF